MTTAHKKGLNAEKWAALFLLLKGYIPVAWRVRTHVGEIDLIVRKKDVLCFVEVKLRKTIAAAAEAVHAENQERVRRAAELYLQRHPRYTIYDLRFDAVAMAPWRMPQHITDAF